MSKKLNVVQFLQHARMMEHDQCLPDGQWEDGLAEIWDDLKKYKLEKGALPDAEDEIWGFYEGEIQRNQNWWI